MSFPRYSELELPLLRLIYELGGAGFQIRTSDAYAPLAASFGLEAADLARTRNDVSGDGNSTPIWNNRVQWARNSLRKRGLLAESPPGYWRLSESGIAKARAWQPLALRHVSFPDELPDSAIEGAQKRVLVNAYERSAFARQACIEHYGYRCAVCAFDFEASYGDRGRNFIHVHHVVPIASIGTTYVVNPVRDLRPVCPNCHAMIHRTTPPCSLDELSAIVKEARASRQLA
jgi:5-methylcytosine-specific restriction enzyme A